MSRATGLESRRAGGFTLVELLVAITILGLLAALLFGGFRLGARAWERGEARIDQAGEIQIVQTFLRQRIGEAAAVWAPDENDPTVLLFDGDARHLTFVTVMPVYLQTGGYSVLDLDYRPQAEGGELLLRWRPFRFGTEEQAADQVDERVLLSSVRHVEFAYFGRIDDQDRVAAWHDAWRQSTRLPELVRLRLEFADASGRRWPELVAAPAVTTASRQRR